MDEYETIKGVLTILEERSHALLVRAIKDVLKYRLVEDRAEMDGSDFLALLCWMEGHDAAELDEALRTKGYVRPMGQIRVKYRLVDDDDPILSFCKHNERQMECRLEG